MKLLIFLNVRLSVKTFHHRMVHVVQVSFILIFQTLYVFDTLQDEARADYYEDRARMDMAMGNYGQAAIDGVSGCGRNFKLDAIESLMK